MPDEIIKSIAGGGLIRATAMMSTAIVDEAARRHQTTPVATVALGRALTGALLLAATQQKSGRLTMRVLGDGPLGAIVIDAGTDGDVRGYVQFPDTEVPVNEHGTFDVGTSVGRGMLHVTYAFDYGTSYTSTVELASGEIGGDLTRFLAVSEQVPSAVMLGVYIEPDGSVGVAGGLIVSLMPGAGDEIAERLENSIASVATFTEMWRGGMNLEAILNEVLGGFAVEILERSADIAFRCRCSRERILGAMQTLPQEELQTMIREDHGAEVTCHFCADKYKFSEPDLEELLTISA
ncbi:MAG: Hsp33 family molecular chaperone HslO [Candidatus Sericytochromatia bacterium]|nr:Hsp33 family molecular chaperone HslO [Candidatus Sericytochromatia bacterium]